VSSHRSAREVIEAHLELSRSGSVEDDLERNYAPEVTCFIREGIHHGRDGLRQLAERLSSELPDATLEYTTVLVEGDVGFVEWTATSEHVQVSDGADSYVVRDGRIVAQTIHYTVEPRDPAGDPGAAAVPRALHNPEAST
jgi:ketosteroid isomerase-like protein